MQTHTELKFGSQECEDVEVQVEKFIFENTFKCILKVIKSLLPLN
jgi:hypothetical protein